MKNFSEAESLADLEEDCGWDLPPMPCYVSPRASADPLRRGTVLLEVPLDQGDADFYYDAFGRFLAPTAVAPAMRHFSDWRALWSHHWTNRIVLHFVGPRHPVTILRSEENLALESGEVEFILPTLATRTAPAPPGAPSANASEQEIMRAIRVTVARIYRLLQHTDPDIVFKLEKLLRPIGREFGLNASHFKNATRSRTPTFDACEGRAREAFAELFPGEPPADALDALCRRGKMLTPAERKSVETDELNQLTALLLWRQAAHSQELAARDREASREKVKAQHPDREPRMTRPMQNRIVNQRAMHQPDMPSTIRFVRAALTTGIVFPLTTFPTRTYLLPLLYAARFIGALALNRGKASIAGSLTAAGLAAVAVNRLGPADRGNPDVVASLYLADILTAAGVDLRDLYHRATRCLVERAPVQIECVKGRHRFIPPPLPT